MSYNRSKTFPGRAIVMRLRAVLLAGICAAPLACIAGAAHAQMMWPGETYESAEPPPPPPPIRRRVMRPDQRAITSEGSAHHGKHGRPVVADTPDRKPHGPLIIAVSIEQQHLRVYDSDGLFAESPVSTGKHGHSTPMGVFSIIQKAKWHRSNIYSSAPMPYMQRITWSGVALHAGVVPGYPASHGCIRLPAAFAVKMYGWTRLGARVIVAPGDVAPTVISHIALVTHAPQPATSSKPDTPVAPANGAEIKPNSTLEKTAAETVKTQPAEDTPLRSMIADRVHVADAAADMPADGSTKRDLPAGPLATGGAAAPAKGAGELLPAAEQQPASTAKGSRTPTDVAAAAVPPKEPAQIAAPVDPAASKRSGHIAVLISRKEARLYVRQNFEPWFDVPITIAQADRPLGTHVFTASADASKPGNFQWSVISLPQLARQRDPADGDARPRGKRMAAVVAEPLPQQQPAAADTLDRLKLPEDAMAKIAAALAPGGSIIVSDRGLGDETGLGTDFIVPLR